MRMLQIVTRRQRRGAEVFAADLSTALARRDVEVHYIGLSAPPERPLTPPLTRVGDVSTSPVGILPVRTVLRLARCLRRVRPDLVQANGGYAMKCAVLGRWLSRGGAPIVYCNIGFSSDWLRRPGQRRWNRWLLGRVDGIAAVSEASRRDLVETFGLDPGSVRVVRRGPSLAPVHGPEAGSVALEAEGVPSDARVLLHVGSFTPEKNHAGLLRIVERVRERIESVHLVLAGDGPLRDEIASTAPSYVHVLGVRHDVPLLMAGADVLVLPSLTEGIPGVILEAAVQGLVAVAYDVGGVDEVVREGRTGRLIEKGNEVAAAEAIEEILDDPDRRRELEAGARNLVRNEYALERSVEAFEALYDDVLSRVDG